MGYQNVKRVFDIPRSLISTSTRLTLLSLAERADDGTLEAWPGNADFVKRTSLHRATIWRVIDSLEGQRVVTVTPPLTGGNEHSTNRYRLNWNVVQERLEAGLPIGPASRAERPVAKGDSSHGATSASRLVRRAGRPPRRAGRPVQRPGRSPRPKPEEPSMKRSPNRKEKQSSPPAAVAAREATSDSPRRRPRNKPTAKTVLTASEAVDYFVRRITEKAQQEQLMLVDPVNRKALTNQVRRWTDAGVGLGQVVTMMDLFLDGPLPTAAPVWKAFADKRNALLRQVRDNGLGESSSGAERYATDYWEDD
jgi:hypothetical protein